MNGEIAIIKKQDEKIRLQKITAKKTKSLHSKLNREAIFTNLKPWHAIFVVVTPTIISVVIFSSYQIFDKWIATQWGWGDIIVRYRHIIDISPSEALKIVNIATTYAAVPIAIAVAFSLLVSIGTSVKFSIAYGKNKGEKMAYYLGNGFLTSFFTSIIFMLAMYFIIPAIIEFQAGSDTNNIDYLIRKIIIEEAVRFSRILILASPLLFFVNFWLSLIRSEGRIFTNIIIIIISCLINIMLDFIFVIPANLGMAGTAYATIISWFLIFVMAIILIYYSDSNLKFGFRHLKLKKGLIFGILIIGLSSLLENAAQSILAMMTIKILNALPPPLNYPNPSNIPVYLQLYGAIMPWLILINALIIGVSQGARVLVGYVYGTRNYYRVWQIMWRLIILLLVLLSTSLVLVILIGQYMMNIFGVDLTMANHFKSYIIMQFAFYPLATLHFTAIIFYQGINRGQIALLVSLQRTVIIPALCLGLGYFFARQTNNGFYFYVMIGAIDLFGAFILFPLLLHAFFKSRPYVKRDFESRNQVSVVEIETLNLEQK